ncbi:MAG: hypothetical protein LQ352_007133 [Teloschistes flavicans]|nr:MAG: hypothetical protein LQ352_007133 [Teloschistes flavicans]
MDIHRCRFVPYPPSAINALAFSHSSSLATTSKGPPTLRLAIGRANGDIEIWNPLRGAWHQESIFRGGKDRSIEGLVWTQDPEEQDKNGINSPGRLRLFSIGYSGSVTEWDLNTGRPLRHASGNYGELWCMAAQPRLPSIQKIPTDGVNGVTDESPRYQSIAVGCADGSIVLMSTADGDLEFQRTLTRPPKRKARILSIAWQNSFTVVTGHADSTIRIFDTRNGNQIRSMSLGAGPQGGPKEILVWAVKCMADGTIVSGDSTGTVSFWDAKQYARLQRITSHEADILDLAVSVDGETVISGGMDRRTTLYRRSAGSKPGEKRRWVEIAHQRFHSHDVKAMATFETKGISILASGGLDTTPIIVPIREFGREHHRTLSSLPQQPPLRSAPRKGLLLSWWDREVSLWRISKPTRTPVAEEDLQDLPQPPSRRLMARMLLKGDESITSADLVENGTLLAVTTLAELKVFQLNSKHDSNIRLRKLNLDNEIANIGAKIVQFSPDGKWLLLITSCNKIQILRIVKADDPKKAPHVFPQSANLKRVPRKPAKSNYLHGSLGGYDRSISCVAFSADSRILVVSDLSGHLDTFVLEGREDLDQHPSVPKPKDQDQSSSSSSSSSDESDSEDNPTLFYAQHWRRNPAGHLIPSLPSAPLILTFRPNRTSPSLECGTNTLHSTRHNPHPHSHELPTGEDRLLVLTARHRIHEFNVLAGRISDWSRRNPTLALPKDFREIRDRAMGFVWDLGTSPTRSRQRVWFYGSGWLWMFDLGQDLPAQPRTSDTNIDEDEGPGKEVSRLRKRKRAKRQGILRMIAETDEDGAGDHERDRDTGAGSRIPAHELQTGIGRKMRKMTGAEGKDTQLFEVDRTYDPSGDDEDIGEESSALMHLRRGDKDVLANENENLDDVRPPAFWGTYRYRPIFGIVPIGCHEGESDAVGQSNGGVMEQREIEVALVERPMFEVDLPGRYHGDHEWAEKKDKGVELGI